MSRRRGRHGGRVVWHWYALALALLLTGSHAESGEVYRWVDEAGTVHFGDRPPQTAQSQRIEMAVPSLDAPPVAEQLDRFLQARTDAPTARQADAVTIYTTQGCPHCERAKSYFADHGIAYTEYDIDVSRAARQEFLRLGGIGVPLIMVGDKKLHGFSAARFARLYAER